MNIKFSTESQFRYLWLKKVSGVCLSKHCAQCLVGNYHKEVNEQTKSGDFTLNDGVWYFCGVANPSNWSNNFHLAFISSPEDSFVYGSNGISVSVIGARRITFSEADIDILDPNIKLAQFRTCRNWQFAHYLNRNPELL